MSEQDLIELGFERYNETDPKIGDWYYYSSYWNGIDLISNASDEWDSDGLCVSIIETDILFRSLDELCTLKELLGNNLK